MTWQLKPGNSSLLQISKVVKVVLCNLLKSSWGISWAIRWSPQVELWTAFLTPQVTSIKPEISQLYLIKIFFCFPWFHTIWSLLMLPVYWILLWSSNCNVYKENLNFNKELLFRRGWEADRTQNKGRDLSWSLSRMKVVLGTHILNSCQAFLPETLRHSDLKHLIYSIRDLVEECDSISSHLEWTSKCLTPGQKLMMILLTSGEVLPSPHTQKSVKCCCC